MAAHDLPAAQDAAARWAERLMCLIKEHGSMYVLLERFHGMDERLAAVDQCPVQMPLPDPYYGEALHRSPLLVRLTMQELPLLDETAAVAAEAALDPTLPLSPVCAWLHVDADVETVAQHLVHRMHVYLLHRAQEAFFCYFDPRVMPRLTQMLCAEELVRLFGPVALWAMPGRNGDLIEVQRPAQPQGSHDCGLVLSEAKADALTRVATVSDALRLIHAYDKRVPHGDEERLDTFVINAQKLELTDTSDQACYAALAYLWREQCFPNGRDEDVRRCIELAHKGVPLARALHHVCGIQLQAP